MSGNTKKRFSFNVLDVFIILLVVILIASVVYKIYQNSKKDANQDNPVYTVVFECEDYESLASYLLDGEEVYIKSSGELLGYIHKSGDVIGAYALVILDDADTEGTSSSDLYDRMKFEGKLKLNGNTKKSREGNYYVLEDLNLTVGSKIEVYTEDTEFTITIKQFTDKNGN